MKIRIAILLICATALAAVFFLSGKTEPRRGEAGGFAESREIAENTWNGYKRYFIKEDGRVARPREQDTVSEGQAYAMLRAVWMGDKETFDRCYRWTELNLSRENSKGDSLLAWHWKSGSVTDWMPASDADIDYGLSLVLASARWKNRPPEGMSDYVSKAKKVLQDILNLETYATQSGRLYLSPWILENKETLKVFPVNPSYYSPAHFRVFYEFDRDARWLKLADTAYFMLSGLSAEFNGIKGVGLIPDWCSVDASDNFLPFEGKNDNFGWEAVRIPFRIGLDYLWFKFPDARTFLASGIAKFAEHEWRKDGAIFCEYAYNGTPGNKFENPLFYAAYYVALEVAGSALADGALAKNRSYIKQYGKDWVYVNPDEYYVNSLAWLADGFRASIPKNFLKAE